MDENEGLLPPEREYNMPTAQEEFNEPAPEQEHLFRAETPVEPVAVISAPAGRAGAVRRAVRYVAATAAAAVVLSQAPAPPAEIEPDWIDLPTDTKITCAAVRPDEPDRLYVSDVSLAHSEGTEELRLSYYLDYPDGTSIPCGRGTACGREAIVSELDGWVRGDSTYILYDDAEENPYDYDSDPSFWENNVHNGNLGIMLRRIPIDSYVEGMVFREVLTFRIDGDYYRMTSTRPVQLLPPDPEIRTELEALDLGDGYAVIGHRHALGATLLHTLEHKVAVKHAATAMNDQIVTRHIVGKVLPGHDVDGQSLARPPAQHARYLFTANVLGKRGMGAGFGNEHAGLIGQSFDGCGTLGKVIDIPLVGCHQHRERGQQTVLRFLLFNDIKHL